MSLDQLQTSSTELGAFSTAKKKMIGWFLGFWGDYNGERENISTTLFERRGVKTRVFSPLLYFFPGNFAVAQKGAKEKSDLSWEFDSSEGEGGEGRLKAI